MNATSNVPGTFSYSPAVGTVLNAGTYTLQVMFTPTDSTDYSVVTSSVSLIVTSTSQSTPTVSWGTPGPITYGSVLSGSQLNASANVAGSFNYSPALGTLLSAGTQVLQVTFTPRTLLRIRP